MPPDTQDTVPRVRVVGWEWHYHDPEQNRGVWSRFAAGEEDAQGFNPYAFHIQHAIREGRLRAIVAVPRKCGTCNGNGDIHWCTRCDTSLSRPRHHGLCGCTDLPSPRSAYTERRDCQACDATGYERCPTCKGEGIHGTTIWSPHPRPQDDKRKPKPCPDCINGVLHDEHEVGVSEAIEKGIAGLMVASGIKGSVHAAAVLSTLIGDREGSET